MGGWSRSSHVNFSASFPALLCFLTPGFSHDVVPPTQYGTSAELAKKSAFKSQGKRRGQAEKDTGVGEEKKKREVDGYCKLNWLGEGSDFHCDEPE